MVEERYWLTRGKCFVKPHRFADFELGIDSTPAVTYRGVTSRREVWLLLESLPCLWASVPDVWELDSSM